MWNISSKQPQIKKDKEFTLNNDTYLNRDLVRKIDDLANFDESVSHKLMEDIHHTELAAMFENADERDLLTVCYIAVRKSPVKYLTVLMDYLLERSEPPWN